MEISENMTIEISKKNLNNLNIKLGEISKVFYKKGRNDKA